MSSNEELEVEAVLARLEHGLQPETAKFYALWRRAVLHGGGTWGPASDKTAVRLLRERDKHASRPEQD